MPVSLTIRAHAKLNLALSVGPPRPPKGYHPIASWFAPIDLHDDVTVRKLEAGAPSRHEIRWAADAPRPTPIDWPPERDLAVRAHRVLERHVGRELPVALTVEKRTPVGGGLGGGSSDAAAALVGVNRVHGLGIDGGALRAISVALGSDVAFFLDERCVAGGSDVPRAALVGGFGEQIERIDSPRGGVLLFFPPFGCPTGAVYGAFDASPTAGVDMRRVRALVNGAAAAGGVVDERALFNDLGGPACSVEPRLADVWERLRRACAPDAAVHLTGSGSTLFAMVAAGGSRSLRERCREGAPEVTVVDSGLCSS